MKQYHVSYVNHGIANRYSGRFIEIHNKLLLDKYRPLYNEILKHEMAHSEGKYTKNDIALDIAGFKNKRLYWQFILTTPSSWVQFSPMYRSRGKWYFDLTLIIFWYIIFVMMIGGLAIWMFR